MLQPLVGIGTGEDLSIEADADQPLRWAPMGAPEAGRLPGEGQAVLAGFAIPGAQAGHAAADLHRVRLRRVQGDPQ